jgi:fatty-acyl-CoA synthase
MLPSYAHGISSVPLLGETIGENLRRTVERFGDREALVSCHQGYRASYRQLWQETGIIGRALMARGVKKGDRVGLWSPNRYEWVVTQYATSRIGAIMVNINPAYRSHELEHVLKQSACSLLVLARGFRQTDYVSMFREVEARLPEHIKSIVLDDEWGMPCKKTPSTCPRRSSPTASKRLDPDDPIDIQYTSGTTGFPKGATLSHHNILNNGYFVGRTLKYSEKDRICIAVPLYHCFGQVMGNLAATSPRRVHDFSRRGLRRQGTVLATVEKERCTSLYGVPTMFIAETEHANFAKTDFASLRTGIMAGSPCPIEVMKRVQKDMHMPEITICYGMTETAPVSTQSKVDDPLDKRVSPRWAACTRNLEVKIVDASTGRVVPRGERGRAVHARLFRHARLLGRPALHPPGHRCRPLDAYRRPGGHGRRRLRQHRRPHQGHGHARGREHLPARGRGVPLHQARDRRRASHRRAGREVRRGAHGVDQAAPRRQHRGRRVARLLQGQDRDVQDPALLEVRGRLPHDRHGQGPEVQDARD